MDNTWEIGPAGRVRFGGSEPGGAPPGGGRRRRRDRRPRLDEVRVTPPGEATLRLLHQRILDTTRHNLALCADDPGQPRFAASPVDSAEDFVGRVLSEQNWLAARRRGEWSDEQIDCALRESMAKGLEETLEILRELGDLDAEAWDLLASVMDELHRKVSAAASEEGGEQG